MTRHIQDLWLWRIYLSCQFSLEKERTCEDVDVAGGLPPLLLPGGGGLSPPLPLRPEPGLWDR